VGIFTFYPQQTAKAINEPAEFAFSFAWKEKVRVHDAIYKSYLKSRKFSPVPFLSAGYCRKSLVASPGII